MGFRPIDSGGGGGGGSGTVTNTGTLTLNQLVIGNGGVDIKVLGTLGTTTTLLHGNAAGAPTFAAVSLSTDVTGTLPTTSMPALTGDVTTVAGTVATTISVGAVTDAKGSLLVKPAVAVVAVANLALTGEQTIDGVLTSGSLVLATAQSTGAQNGPWVTAAGAWARPGWYTSGSTTQAPQFLTTFVRLGTTYAGSTWRMTTAAVTIDTTTTAWAQTAMVLGATSVSGTLPVANGGTAIASYAVGDILYASGATTLSKLADVAAGSYLRSGGVTTAPLWSTTTLPNAATQGDLLHASAANVYSNLAAVAAGQVLISAGTSTAPAWSPIVTLTQGTITSDAPQITGTVTWNNAGISGPAWKLNVTATSAGANALLVDLQVASSSVWRVDRTGRVIQSAAMLTGAGTAALPAYSFAAHTSAGMYDISGALGWAVGGTVYNTLSSTAMGLRNTHLAGWTSGDPSATALDTAFGRAAAGRVEVNSGTATTFRDLIARQLFAGGDNAGLASSTSLTNATNTTITNAYVVNGGQAATTSNTGWIKIYVGTVVSWIPYWSNATP